MKKWQTREVLVGNVGVGGHNPIRLQSMTTSNTRDIEATVAQAMKLADAGCDIVRMTVQGMKEADACEEIKNVLVKRGYNVPLVADIHFYPPAAMRVADFVDKVRINPGNFVDKRASFKVLEYDDATYSEEIERITEKFTPLVEKCKRLKRAMRIGTNHGSLSDRIMNRYGDSPSGMVESALEFARVCRALDYHDIIFSMKASNTQVMIQAYRELVAKMQELGWDYPLHLGVTEAGEGEDGRVKSSIGIGSLLLEGIGDTIRVSLTEDPWSEIDPCGRLARLGHRYRNEGLAVKGGRDGNRKITVPYYLHRDGSVIVKLSKEEIESPLLFEDLGCKVQLGRPSRDAASVDGVLTTEEHSQLAALEKGGIHLFRSSTTVTEDHKTWESAKNAELIFFAPSKDYVTSAREFFAWMNASLLKIPVILEFAYDLPADDLVIVASAEYGALLADGFGEGICLTGPYSLAIRKNLSFAILQGCRRRLSKTEFISCPGCGRTLFDLQQVAKRIRDKTAHLPGVKIAIMGCIVNGPGEMADADFGYVGSKPGKIDLYLGKECVEKDIAFADADDRLIDLIKAHGRWIESDLVKN